MNWQSGTVTGKIVKLVLLLQFLAVSLIPQGMMTSFANDSFTLVICTPEGIKEIAVPSDEEQQLETSSDCVFSLHADQHLSVLSYHVELVTLSTHSSNRVSDSHLASLQRHLAYGSRAPPYSS
ncbi:DUF2946 family protein [Kiloniella sp. EL199]|uniref:DUF2946 family protein n=1 Tax=Kiloniella sp. EL199 TaxID=2107581 RepID=UPI000EA28736|nr:DUF2946 family protein [Kiloniella sp. EL199]